MVFELFHIHDDFILNGNFCCHWLVNDNYFYTIIEIENSYIDCNWRAHFLTNVAVSDKEGDTTFFSSGDFKNMESGGGILSPDLSKNSHEAAQLKAHTSNADVLVKTIKLSKFINEIVATRKIPEKTSSNAKIKNEPNVVMKLDIEGSEIDVVPDLVFSGSLQHLDGMMIEWHQFLITNETVRERADKVSKSCNFNLIKALCFIISSKKGTAYISVLIYSFI